MAAVGLWASYQTPYAFRLFLAILFSGILFFYIGSRTPEKIWIIPPILNAFGFVLVVFFLLTQDWHQFKADVELIDRVGAWWMTIRPALPLSPPHQNMVAGTLSLIIPFNIVWFVRERTKENQNILFVIAAVTIFLAFGLWSTSSRGAWFSLSTGLILSAGIYLSPHHLKLPWLNSKVVIGLAVLGLIVGFAFSYHRIQNLAGSFEVSNNVNSLDSRVTLYRNAIELARGNWLIGEGLGSFSGLYSSYILILPVPVFYYSHNIYLDIWIELGLLGLVAWLIILIGSILFCVRYLLGSESHDQGRLLAAGLLAGLFGLTLHGLIDNPLYAAWGRPLLFVLPGMAFVFNGENEKKQDSIPGRYSAKKIFSILSAIVVIILSLYTRPIRSAWNANIGSILMAKTQLSDWPSGKWTEKSMAGLLVPATKYFKRSLDLQATNRTANYRLGLIAYYGQDFPSAEHYLSIAFQADEHHHGVQKTLGYTYVWRGEFTEAIKILEQVPEAKEELGVYTWWWKTQDRNDLAENARKMNILLEKNGS